MAEIKITAENFENEVLNCAKPILLDFWATWCGPCKMIAPVLEEVAEKYADRIAVGKINVDEEMALSMQHKIASIPALMVYQNGKLVAKTVGYHSLSELEGWLVETGLI